MGKGVGRCGQRTSGAISLGFVALAALALALSMSGAATGKTLLVFEIDEGMPGGLTDVYRDDPDGLETCLQNVYASLSTLTPAYDVAVLVYPTHLYDKQAYAEPGAEPIDTVHPRLLELLEFFATRRSEGAIGVMLEIYSSGIGTNQDGHLASKPKPSLFARGDDGRDGLSMDLDAVAALARKWPETLIGLRFHETLGSDLVWRAVGDYGFPFDEELARAVVRLCRERGLLLLWSDPHWLAMQPGRDDHTPQYVYDVANLPYIEREPFASLFAFARRELGEHVCFSWANNSYQFTTNLEYLDVKVGLSEGERARPIPPWLLFDQPFNEFPMKKWVGSKWGMSIQSWFWHELTNVLNGRYFLLGELSCPAEVLGAFAKKGLREGASVLQFEPTWFFFNMETPLWPESPSGYQDRPDYSEKLDLARLKRWLLDPDAGDAPPGRLEPFFDRDQRRFHENDVSSPPLIYSQALLGLLPSEGNGVYYDSFIDGLTMARADADRFTEDVFGGEVLAVVRGEFQGDGVDDIAVVRRGTSGAKVLKLFNAKSGLLYADESIVADNDEGAFVALTCLNALQEVVGQGDPDEILVLRRSHDGARLSPRLYRIPGIEPGKIDLRFEPLGDEANSAALADLLPADLPDPEALTALLAQRSSSVLYVDFTRPRDRPVLVVQDDVGSTGLVFADGGRTVRLAVPRTNDVRWPMVSPVMLDIDHDRTDELCFVSAESSQTRLTVCDLDTDGLYEVATYPIDIPADAVSTARLRAFGLRCTVVPNAKPRPRGADAFRAGDPRSEELTTGTYRAPAQQVR